jgi:hypothetical protein
MRICALFRSDQAASATDLQRVDRRPLQHLGDLDGDREPLTTTLPLAKGWLLARIWTSSVSVALSSMIGAAAHAQQLVDRHLGLAQHDGEFDRNEIEIGLQVLPPKPYFRILDQRNLPAAAFGRMRRPGACRFR